MDDLKFSQRIGITPAKKKLQVDSIDEDLRNGLWNVYYPILNLLHENEGYYNTEYEPSLMFQGSFWKFHKKGRTDEFSYSDSTVDYLESFFFEIEWYEVYNLIEFSLDTIEEHWFENCDFNFNKKEERKNFNEVLIEENSAYRFINEKLAPITNSNEIEEIQKAIDVSGSFTALKGCNIHLTEALNKLSDKQNPDYRNSIKESISAVESIAKVISGNEKDSLGASLNCIKGKLKIHQALERGFKSIFGYTSDEGGVRHGMMDDPNLDIEDARFMLVSCSAFVNYLIAKAEKADIELT